MGSVEKSFTDKVICGLHTMLGKTSSQHLSEGKPNGMDASNSGWGDACQAGWHGVVWLCVDQKAVTGVGATASVAHRGMNSSAGRPTKTESNFLTTSEACQDIHESAKKKNSEPKISVDTDCILHFIEYTYACLKYGTD